MKKQKLIIAATALGLLAALFLFGESFVSGIRRGLSYCSNIIIPSLFPFMVASSLAAFGDLPDFLKKLLNKPMKKLFSLPPEALTVIFLGMVGGYPVGARTANAMLTSGKLTPSQAKRLLLFCVNSGAGFAINALGSAMLGSRESGKVIFFSGCIASLILGFICSFIPDKDEPVLTLTAPSASFSKAIVESVASSSSGMLTICGFVCVFSGISEIILSLSLNETFRTVIVCILEVTSGCTIAVKQFSLPMICAVTGFGGLCIHMQIFAICNNFRPDFKSFYLFRILHALLSALICRILLYFFPITAEVFLTFSENAAPWSFSAPSAVSLLFLSALLILDLDTEKKIC